MPAKVPVDGSSALSYTLWKPAELSTADIVTLVVFINGLLTAMEDWARVGDEITSGDSSLAALSFDRWNCGQSDSLPERRQHNDISSAADDTACLVRQVCSRHQIPIARLRLILVCSSIGCSVARLFIQRYSRPVHDNTKSFVISGVLLLDPYMSNTDFTSLFPPETLGEPEPLTRTRKIITSIFHPSVGNREGLDRSTAQELLPQAAQPKFPGNPELLVVGHDASHTANDMVEKIGIDKACFLEYVQSAWEIHNKALTTLSSNGTLVTADGSGHFINRDRPELVVQQILDMYREVYRRN